MANRATVLLGLAGYKQVGKDTTAHVLSSLYGFTELAFADPLRAIALAANPLIPVSDHAYARLSDLVAMLGWDTCKETYPEVRRFLQCLGTEGVRVNLGDNTWVDKGIRTAKQYGYAVIKDVRFPNEGQAVKEAGGYVIRINRPGCVAGEHASERMVDLITPDFTLENTGTMADLEPKVTQILRELGVIL